jgi:hypothetical protein
MKSKLYFVLFTISLASCTPVATLKPSSTLSMTWTPAFTVIPQISTVSPSETSLQVLSPTPLPLFPLDGYIILFIKDGDLYFQDGNNSQNKLTHVGAKSFFRLLSDDNQKLIFSRGDGNIYSINMDGTRERTIIADIKNVRPPSPLLPGNNKWVVDFVPGTHQLLFETAECESQEFESPCSTSLSVTDTDTGATKNLGVFGLSIQQNTENRNIKASPNGKMIAVGTVEGTDILTLDGKVVRHNLLPYTPSTKTVLFPSVFWLPDSSGLIVALPNTFYKDSAYVNFPASTIWQYKIDSNVASQMRFDPAPMGWTFQVSPDGKYIAYGGIANDEAVHLGNLADGHIQSYGQAYAFEFAWSPDSQYFIATNAESFMGAVGMPALLSICQLDEWIDANHFICWHAEGNESRLRMAEISAGTVNIYDLGFGKDIEEFQFIKPK